MLSPRFSKSRPPGNHDNTPWSFQCLGPEHIEFPAVGATETGKTSMTPEAGTYALVLFCSQAERVRIGKLGPLRLRRGVYVYVGSARGPGGVRARVAHHQKLSPRPHWHIDYLRPHTRLDRIWYSHGRRGSEHQWASVFRALPGASIPMAGFGSSDCQCEAHLFFFRKRPSFREFANAITFRAWIRF